MVASRNSYRYPPAHIVVGENSGDYPLTDKLFLRFRPAKEGGLHSSKALDSHHFRLLNSESDHEIFAGIASVIYWGFFSSAAGKHNDGRARSQARFFLTGRKNARHRLELHQVADTVRLVRQLLEQKRFGHARRAVSDIQELGQVSFASKVITFLDPHHAAVFDSIISNKVMEISGLAHLKMDVNHNRISKSNQEKYRSWCEVCSSVASSLNQGIHNGEPWQWTDWDGSKHDWRAVDVERALFAANPQIPKRS
ncbi:hypothetical protein BH24DEI2_BH24DEI2_17710 [soil metagenome]